MLSFDRNPYQDGFALIVSTPGTPLTVRAEPRPAEGRPRARRFEVSVPIRYRLADDHDWHAGVTKNISHSGVLFRVDRTGSGQGGLTAATPGTPVAMILDVPTGAADTVTEVRAEGRLVRVNGSAQRSVAVAVRGYWPQ